MVKGQMYTAESLVTKTAPSYGLASIEEPATQWEAFEQALSWDEWLAVADAVDGRFFASVFDLDALFDYPYKFVKIASADITYRGLIEAAAMSGADLILSTGGATLEEINTALTWCHGVRPTLLVCTLCYPTAPQSANVRRVKNMRLTYADTGYSDHTRGIVASALAFDYGAVMVEKHFTIKPGTGGDHDFAIGPEELSRLSIDWVPLSRTVRELYGGTATIGPVACETDALTYARRSIHAKGDIAAGTKLKGDMLTVIRPADGIAPAVDLIGALLTKPAAGVDAFTPYIFTMELRV